MKQLITFFLLGIATQSFAQEVFNKNITPFNDAKNAMIGKTGIEFTTTLAWQNFVKKHPTWGATFYTYNNMPHRAFGAPIAYGTGDVANIAKQFLNIELAAYNIPTASLEVTGINTDAKYTNVNFKQIHNGHEVLFSRITFRFNAKKEIMLFGIDAYNNIPNTTATITGIQAQLYAEGALSTPIINSTLSPDYKILPMPLDGILTFIPVYEIMVNTQDTKEQNGQYYTLVNAITGDIVYRQNKVVSITSHINGDTYARNKWSTPIKKGLPYINVNVAGTNYYADAQGNVTIPNTGATNATINLQGKWCKVLAGANSTATISHAATLLGNDTLLFDITLAATKYTKINAYYHVNIVHDFMKSKLPTFTGLDNALTTRVDRTDGSCNAFYNGTSINFYEAGGANCAATATIADVVYHEYGHGINSRYYSALGGNFANGAMGEGYADVWAMSIVNWPVIGPGFYNNSATTGIRRYDTDNKVYPTDIIGEVHADGEIIAGAWWDVNLNWGSLDSTSTLFADAMAGLATGPDGTEGKVYHDILIDALSYDDVDANITNGTPHFFAIAKAFAKHGIFLNFDATIKHNPTHLLAASTPIVLNADVLASYPVFIDKVKIFFRKRPGTGIISILDSLNLVNTSGTIYSVNFPAKQAGDLYEYYFGMYDNYYLYKPAVSAPFNSYFSISSLQRNVPYNMIFGLYEIIKEDFETGATGWTIGASNDGATSSGKWLIAKPIGTSLNAALVQTDKDHTSGLGNCVVTGNAASTSINAGDVDNGRTSFFSPVLDLSKMVNPVVSYYRWFSNSQGNNPRSDFWRVAVTDNGGVSWTSFDRTFEPDPSWRRVIGRIKDIKAAINLSKIQFAFFAVDSASGGSTVEAAVDDFSIWDIEAPTLLSTLNNAPIFITPNPANASVTIAIKDAPMHSKISITDIMGKTLYQSEITEFKTEINTSTFINGMYIIKILDDSGRNIGVQKLQIEH
jgi:Zn-dependent metalloprotease